MKLKHRENQLSPSALTIDILRASLGLGNRADNLDPDSALMGNIPEFDSMAVVSVIQAIEERLDCEIEDDEINAEVFETVQSLTDFVATKM